MNPLHLVHVYLDEWVGAFSNPINFIKEYSIYYAVYVHIL